MQFLRTDDSRFSDLPDYDFAPHYSEVPDGEGGTLRIHHIDEGPHDAGPVLLLHGEPTWSYLYRHMIPPLVEKGHRVLAPDLVGFGRSDKPVEQADYTYARHVAWMTHWLEQADLREITLFAQDWGGLIGLRLLAAMPDRFARVVLGNTALPTGDQPMGEAFKSWQAYSQEVEDFNAGRIVYGGTTSKLTEAEIAAYNAPFPDDSYKAGARRFPMLVPGTPDDPEAGPNREAWKVLSGLSLPVLTTFGADDKIMAGVEKVFQKQMPGAGGQDHVILPEAGHFLQEDVGPELARRITAFIRATP
ncbi:MAG: haloalkane dehalogenase [Sulfitobacter sp.]|nr:haloalkane dehalogenase [Sulfitobacter sp.]